MDDSDGIYDHVNKTDFGLFWKLKSFKLENETELNDVEVNYRVFGQLNENRDNAIVVCHGFSGNSAVNVWWKSFFERNMPFDTKKYFIICANMLGSCYGTTGPASICSRTGKRYGTSFPNVTIRDSVNLHIKLVRDGLRVHQVSLIQLIDSLTELSLYRR